MVFGKASVCSIQGGANDRCVHIWKPELSGSAKIRNVCSVKDNIKRIRPAENICKRDTSDKGLLSKIYKELLKFNNKKTTPFYMCVTESLCCAAETDTTL